MGLLTSFRALLSRHTTDESLAKDPDLQVVGAGIMRVSMAIQEYELVNGDKLSHDTDTGKWRIHGKDGGVVDAPPGTKLRLADGSEIETSEHMAVSPAAAAAPAPAAPATPEKMATDYVVIDGSILRVGAVGEPVLVVMPDGTTAPAPAMEYVTEDGSYIVVDEAGILVSLTPGMPAFAAAFKKIKSERQALAAQAMKAEAAMNQLKEQLAKAPDPNQTGTPPAKLNAKPQKPLSLQFK